MKKIILATTSSYRQEAFRMIGLDFEVKGSNIDEKFIGRPNSPKELVLELSKQKASAVAKQCTEGIVIGLDSVGWFNNEILEKPQSKEELVRRLRSLSGSSFEYYTGVCFIDIEKKWILQDVVMTKANMRQITNAEIEKYYKQGDRFKAYALGFDTLEHFSSTFVNDISGSYNNLLRGIPTERIIEMLKDSGVEIK
jgi:septum formation protein